MAFRDRSPSPIDLLELDLDAETTNEQMTFLTKPDDFTGVDMLGGETPPSGFMAPTLSRGMSGKTLARNPQQTDWKNNWDENTTNMFLRDLLPVSSPAETPFDTPPSLDWAPA
ncbi:hypothetical protein HK097_005908, partial [Rhizophlyctis rosea]